MRIHNDKVWAGTEESLQASLQADETIQANIKAGNFGQEDDDEDETSRLLEVSGSVAVISIKGSLTNDGDAWWNEMTGRTGYPEIRDALLAAANDQAVADILLDIDSGGGSVAGVADTGSLIRLINDNVKPVTAFTDGGMMSAAYWLGASAGHLYGTKSSMVGSIGVISTHMERSKMLKDAGIGVTVVRSGEFKALANSVEPLTAEGKAQIQKIVDAANGVFVEHVAGMRNTPYATVDNVWGQGREFLADEAVKIGMIDGIKTFDDLMGELLKKSIDASSASIDNRVKSQQALRVESAQVVTGEQEMSKKALTAQDIAAIAAGAPLSAVIDPAVVVDPAASAVETAATAEPVAEAAPVSAAPAVEAVVEDVATLRATVQLLNKQVADKDAALLAAGIENAKLQAQVQAAAATNGPLADIARASINNMRVALNMGSIDMTAMDPVKVLAEHASLTPSFAKNFPIGGVAAAPQVDAQVSGAKRDPVHMARVNAARFQN